MKSDQFYPESLQELASRIRREYELRRSILGIHESLFFHPRAGDRFRMERYGTELETPVGVAAGPHTQLARNIISAWLCGARYIELKTVQTLDTLEISRPCIDMADEGYNCEWSQELTLEQSFHEYANAVLMVSSLRKVLGFSGEPPGFLFNMSVGYSLEGILRPNVQRFMERMTNCAEYLATNAAMLARTYPEMRHIDPGSSVSNSITLSTMHGCPTEEIEKIGRYLIEERRLNTTIKLNPTLLGPHRLRWILNDRLGFSVDVPDMAFEHDLSFEAACDLIRSLQTSASRSGVSFHIKLTNTLEVENRKKTLPEKERMIYLSGRALHPISVHVAALLQEAFEGKLELSFSAGADCFNIADVLACGIRPVTVCSDLLKPGGYGRLGQYLEEIDRAFDAFAAGSLDDFINKSAEPDAVRAGGRTTGQAAHTNLRRYAERVIAEKRYKKESFPFTTIKTSRELPALDCAAAPCRQTCPISQDVPAYLRATANGGDREALDIIYERNLLPAVTGMVCDHRCQSTCTRLTIDEPLAIREIKRFQASRHPLPTIGPETKRTACRVAIVGAGPSGLVCAGRLLRFGVDVTLYEANHVAGGMVADAIPAFRLDDTLMRRDIDAICALGAHIVCDTRVTADLFRRMHAEFDYLYIAVGAARGRRLGLENEDKPGVIDQLSFLSRVRRGGVNGPGRRVIVIGGGNSAMDAARTARRLVSHVEVAVIYRRTRTEMPADDHEITAMLAENITLTELTAPIRINIRDDRVVSLECIKMELGQVDASGRPRPIPISGSEFTIPCDTIISAVGQDIVLDFIPEGRLEVDARTCSTTIPRVFAGGDAIRGASTLIRAMADGMTAADGILEAIGIRREAKKRQRSTAAMNEGLHQRKMARRMPSPLSEVELPRGPLSMRTSVHPPFDVTALRAEAERCLDCDQICNICVSVCPNRANWAIPVGPLTIAVFVVEPASEGAQARQIDVLQRHDRYQIVNIIDFCNACGNCETFCPSAGAPFRDKPRILLRDERIDDAGDHYVVGTNSLTWRTGSTLRATLRIDERDLLYYDDETVHAEFSDSPFSLTSCRFNHGPVPHYELRQASMMYYLLHILRDQSPFAVR